MTTLRFAFLNVFRHRARSSVTIGAIAFGCLCLIFVGGYLEDTFYKMRESYIHSHIGHIQIYRKGFSTEGRRHPLGFLMDDPAAVERLVERVPGVASASIRLEFSGILSTGNNSVACLIQGVDLAKEPPTPLSNAVAFRRVSRSRLMGLIIEDGIADDKDPNGILVGKGLAESVGATVATPVTLVAPTVGGSVNAWDATVHAIFSSSSKPFDDHVIRVPLELARSLARTTNASSIVVMLNDTADTDRVKGELERLFREHSMNLEMKPWYELNDFYQKTKLLFGKIFLVLKFVIATIVTLSIYNTLNMNVLERTDEIGTIRALGRTRSHVMWLFVYEGLFFGLVGGLLGTVAGVAFTSAVGRIGIPMPPAPGASMPWTSEPMVDGASIAFAYGLATATALFSSFLPALRASRVEIAEALRRVG